MNIFTYPLPRFARRRAHLPCVLALALVPVLVRAQALALAQAQALAQFQWCLVCLEKS